MADDIADLKVMFAEFRGEQKAQSEAIAEIKERMVTKERFRPVEAITYGMVVAAIGLVVGVLRSFFSKGA